jgi:hypothetical protein
MAIGHWILALALAWWGMYINSRHVFYTKEGQSNHGLSDCAG